MQGPTQRWDQPPDPRESTVSMPRIDPSSVGDQVGEPATAAYDGGTRMELPGFGDPYALPVRAAGSVPAAAPVPAPTRELPVTPERAATTEHEAKPGRAATPERAPTAEPAVSGLPDPETPPPPATPEPAESEEVVAPETPGQPGAISQDPAGQPRRRAETTAAGRLSPGSVAELRERLERLPDGHPSSPYDGAGRVKPSPTRLRQLELGLPARPVGTLAGYAERFGIDPGDDANDSLPAAAAADSHAQASTPGDELPRTAAAPADTASGPVMPPAKAPSPAARPQVSNGHNDPAEGDGRLQLQHPYAPSADEDGNASAAGDLALTRWQARDTAADRGSGPAQHRNGHHPAAKAPESARAEPADPARAHRPTDPGSGDLSRRGAAARPRLAPELRDLVDRVLAACRAAEGRNARGGYGTSGLTPALRRIAAQLPAGGLAPGSEADTLKTADRFADRLARLIDRQPGRRPADQGGTISDGIRYTFTFPAADYTESTLLVHRKLKAQGFDLEARRNLWDSREYKGIFTRWRDPAHGLAFEVQFHTTDSWAVVKQTHDAYLRITDPATPAAERARLRVRQAAAAATVSPPPGCLDIADFRASAR
jgi:hypothetical protein